MRRVHSVVYLYLQILLVIRVLRLVVLIDKLDIYQGLDVAEVWFWQENRFWVYSRQKQGYGLTERSQFLPDLDLTLLATYVNYPEPLDAMLEYWQALRDRSAGR